MQKELEQIKKEFEEQFGNIFLYPSDEPDKKVMLGDTVLGKQLQDFISYTYNKAVDNTIKEIEAVFIPNVSVSKTELRDIINRLKNES